MRQSLWILLVTIHLSSCSSFTKNSLQDRIIERLPDVKSKMADVDAYSMVYFSDKHGELYACEDQDKQTPENQFKVRIFEGASLSKTVFAYLYWQLQKKYPVLRKDMIMPSCDGTSVNLNPLVLLRHSIASTDSCLLSSHSDSFKYSEDNYIFLQRQVETITGTQLEFLAKEYVFEALNMKNSSFVWRADFPEVVDGYYEKGRFHRPIRKFNEAKSNGTLYTNLEDMNLFAQALLYSDVPDSILMHTVPVHAFSHLSWGNGMGLDKSSGNTLLWQWGSNWPYNHILLMDRKNTFYLLALSNSMIGAKRLRETCNHLFYCDLELFNYINWY